MARSWEYSRGRHIAMQVTMWLILAVTLGLAALVARARGRGMEGLGDPAPLGPLVVRWPDGWSATPARDGDRIVLTAVEPHAASGHGGGVFQITEEGLQGPPASPADCADYLASNFPDQDFDSYQVYFVGLHVTGVEAQIPAEGKPGALAASARPGLYACTIVSLAPGENLAVIASLREPPPITESDKDLFRKLMRAIMPQ